MTLNEDFSAALAPIFDPVTGLGEEIILNGSDINALVRYEIDVDSGGLRFDVLDLDILRSDYNDVPTKRTTAIVDDSTWYFWRQVSADSISRRLRFIRNQMFTSGK